MCVCLYIYISTNELEIQGLAYGTWIDSRPIFRPELGVLLHGDMAKIFLLYGK